MAIITMMGFSVSVTLARKEKSKSMLPALSIGLLISGVFIALIVDPIEAFNLKPELYLLHGVTLAIAVSALAQAARYTFVNIHTFFSATILFFGLNGQIGVNKFNAWIIIHI